MCVNPITLTHDVRGMRRKDTVPCGKCPECTHDKQNEFMIRAVEEQKKRTGEIWFITLTYNDDSVPVAFDENGELIDETLVPRCQTPVKYREKSNSMSYRAQSLYNCDIDANYDFDNETAEDTSFNIDEVIEAVDTENQYTEKDLLLDGEEVPVNVLSLNNKDIVNWKKRVRRRIEYREGRKLDFGYVICGEYGPRTRRPHYHGLLFGLSKEDAMEFKRDWENHNGYTSFKRIPALDVERVGKYVAKYVVKNDCLNDSLMLNGFSQKPRKLTSVGFGSPSKERLDLMRNDLLGDFPVEDINDLDKLQNEEKEVTDKAINRILNNGFKYRLNGKSYKLPQYYKQKLFYVQIEGQSCPSALYGLVQIAVRDRIQKDFILSCITMANQYNLPEDYQTYVDVSQRIVKAEKMERKERAEAIILRDKSSYCKSRF